jgi:hypothetical protein
METIDELLRIREQIESKIRLCQSELGAINKAIELVRRERLSLPASALQLSTSTKTKEFARLGLTDACREVVRNDFVTPLHVRDALLIGGFPVPKKGKGRLLNYVFVTLKRLCQEGGEFERGEVDGKFAVRLRPAPRSEPVSTQSELGIH